MHDHFERYLSRETNDEHQLHLTMKTSTEILIGLHQKSTTITDWLPVISIISALIIAFVAFIILCKRRIDHQRHRSNRSRRSINQNNNQTSLLTIDVAECIEKDFQFISGMNILLSKGNILLEDDDDDIQMLNSMNPFNRLQYFQNLVFNVNTNR